MRRWFFLLPLLLVLLLGAARGERRGGMVKGPIRESVIAGSWYPGDPEVLRGQVLQFLAEATPPPIEGELVALISPHAGYMYSGQVAAYAYKLLKGKRYDVVVIVAPSHRAYFRGASVYPRGGYRTPLGIVPVAERLTERLREACPLVDYVPQAHAQEHSLEIQLPFLQVVLGDFELVPLVMGEHDFYTCEELAKAIVEVVKGERALLVASTDLSHFHPYPQAVALDKVVLEHVEAFDPEGLSRDLRSGRCEACGGGPMVAVMLAAKALGASGAKVLKYANSGDVTGDRSSVVGYMAAAIYRGGGAAEAGDPREGKVGVDLGLTEEEKEKLHEIARTVIRNKVLGEPIPEFHITSPRLKEPRGVFVTIKKHGQLRGCIGYVRAIKPLWQAVADMAEAAAFQDPRFPPVRVDELGELEIEISVLTPLREIKDPEEIEVGKHGIMIERPPYYSGLLLPQVATEYGWDRETFLEQTCIKAGLPPNAWRDPATRIYIFSAEIF